MRKSSSQLRVTIVKQAPLNEDLNIRIEGFPIETDTSVVESHLLLVKLRR